MKPFNPVRLLMFLLCLLLWVSGTSLASIQSVGPTSPITTIPTWYMDSTGLPLEPCLDQNNLCILPGPPAVPNFDPAFPPFAPITTTGPVNDTNFPDEAFYYSAFAADPLGGPGKFTIENGEVVVFGYVLEFAFLSGVVPETAVTFLRTDLQKMRNLTPNSTYRLTHPHGVFEFQTDGLGVTIDAGPGTRFEDQPGTIANWLPPLFIAAPNTNIGPFLTPIGGAASYVTDPLDPNKVYIGDPALPVQVVGSQTGQNFVRIERLDVAGVPVPGALWQTNFFSLMGRVFTGQIPSPIVLDRTTYASNGAAGQVDVFVTALPSAVTTISGTGIAPTILTQDTPNSGKFFTHIPLVGPLPTGVTITNSLDIPPIPYPVTLVDEINITQAIYTPSTKTLTIKASSRDTMSPLPTLTVPAFAVPGNPAANTLDATGTLAIALPSTIPPQTVQVVSSLGGTASAPVSVVIATPLSITTTTLAVGDVNVPYSQPVTAIGGVGPYTWGATGLPGGLTMDPATGLISGTPLGVAIPLEGFVTFPVTISVQDSAVLPETVTAVLSLNINQTAATPPWLWNPANGDTGGFNVGWGASATPGANYVLEQATDAGFTDAVVVFNGTATIYHASGLPSGTYFYRVKTTAAGYVDSSWQTYVTGTVVTGVTAVPTWLWNPATSTTGSFNVGWGASATPGASYVLEQATNSGFTDATVVFSGSTTIYSPSGLLSGTYFYRVKATAIGSVDSAWMLYSTGTLVTVP